MEELWELCEALGPKFRALFDRLVIQGDIAADDADTLNDLLDRIDEMDDEEFQDGVSSALRLEGVGR